jgi:hypothetical protein
MRPLLVVLIIAGLGFVGWRLYNYYGAVNQEQTTVPTQINPERLPGLPSQLETKLREAQTAGPVAFKTFID